MVICMRIIVKQLENTEISFSHLAKVETQLKNVQNLKYINVALQGNVNLFNNMFQHGMRRWYYIKANQVSFEVYIQAKAKCFE